MTLCVSCNSRTQTDVSQMESQQSGFVVNDHLSLRDYSNYQGYLPEHGFVSTAEIAFEIAESVLVSIYGKKKIDAEKPFSITLTDDIWIIEGNLNEDSDGGVAYMEICKLNGEIIKVVHTK